MDPTGQGTGRGYANHLFVPSTEEIVKPSDPKVLYFHANQSFAFVSFEMRLAIMRGGRVHRLASSRPGKTGHLRDLYILSQ